MVTKLKTFRPRLPISLGRGGLYVSVNIRVIPVDGVTALPDIAELPNEVDIRRDERGLLLLNIAAGLAVSLVSCAWILLALE